MSSAPSSPTSPSTSTLSSSESYASESSTPIYEHEPFSTFSLKAHHLLQSHYPNRHIHIWRMTGGSFHRIVGATLASSKEDEKEEEHGEEVILRIPRFPYLRLEDEVAVLQYLNAHTPICTPKVLHHDLTDENAIESPYIILSRLPGKPLVELYPSLPFEHKVRAIKGVVGLLKQFSEVRFNTIGMLVSDSDSEGGVKIDQAWDFAEDIFPRAEDNPRPSAHSSSIRAFLEERWSFHLEEEERCGPSSRSEIAYITAFRTLTESLDLPDEGTPAHIVLFHTDFAPRNIFASEEGEISGVLDWDKAEAAPVEAAWSMPAWLWTRVGSNQLEWVDPDEVPEDEEARKLREVFAEEIGKVLPDFMDVVRKNKVLHQILVFARLGLRVMDQVEKARAFLKEMKVDIPDLGQERFN